MNKSQLVEAISKETSLNKKQSEEAINAFIAVVEKELAKKDGKVQLIGFGTFATSKRKARIGRNPQKPGETVEIPASVAPVFKAGQAFKDAVNK